MNLQIRRVCVSVALAAGILITASPSAAATSEINDIPYYEGPGADPELHRLNLVIPDSDAPVPALLWIHGGAWAFGGRAHEMAFARRMAEDGVAIAAMSYRLSPAMYADPPKEHGVVHPAHIEDVAQAFAWLHEHGQEHGIAPGQIFVGGFSAGGHLSALLATDARWLSAHGLKPEDIRGVIPVSGAYDMEHYFGVIENAYNRRFAEQHVYGVFGSADVLADASPSKYIAALQAPMLVMTDNNMTSYGRVFERLATASGKDIDFVWIDELDHAQLSQNLSHAPDSEYRALMRDFIRRYAGAE